ncbi:putative membrane protein [Halapricum desulfuricans]|uniref:Putative membrane protein n=1 Tax=Halapricum desulfuricans TaxID=2841257 RepID=A0A897NGG2_9EURY|nr:hypothetical protein [Halapricum desulfuricans]QSG11797.1 putative membrane protein [Halapricum desulfuricans]
MTDTLPVHVNRGQLHGLEVPNEVEVSGSFDVVLQNHGESVHVHLHLDDALSDIATLAANNHHVASDSSRRVAVDVSGSGPARGKLKVVTAYGATTRYVDVVLTEPENERRDVTVDESLSKPQPQAVSARSGTTDPGASDFPLRPEMAVLGLGGVALAIAAVAALVLDNTVVLLGSFVVLAGVLVAVYQLIR